MWTEAMGSRAPPPTQTIREKRSRGKQMPRFPAEVLLVAAGKVLEAPL